MGKDGPHKIGQCHRTPWKLLLPWCLLLFAASAHTTSANAFRVSAAGANSRVAIADLDGDVRPDFARIEAGPDAGGISHYFIQLQLSSLGRKSIRLEAPSGGLSIEARDVNGDKAPDLILATAWLHQPVAVYLNDGHGTFSRAETSQFPGAFRDPTSTWSSQQRFELDFLGALPNPGATIIGISRCDLHERSPGRLVSVAKTDFVANGFPLFSSGRAPPSATPSN
jgi:hypothetical protein